MEQKLFFLRYGLIDCEKSFAHTICENFVDEAFMLAFVFKTCLTFQKIIFIIDAP
jgi:hypothetical protein